MQSIQISERIVRLFPENGFQNRAKRLENNFQGGTDAKNKNNYKIATTGTKTRKTAQKVDVSQKTVRLAQEKDLKIGQPNDGQNERIFL